MALSNDKYMTYDLTKHLYTFENELILAKLNIDLELELGSSIEANIFREDCAYFIQDFCIEYSGGRTDYVKKQIAEMIFINDNDERTAIQRVYVELVRYAFNSEGDLVGLQTGVNTVKGQITPLEQLRGSRELSGRLERILKNSHILFRGTRDYRLDEDYTYGVDY